MRKWFLFVMVFSAYSISALAADLPFSIRGTLPWHNFLSGPTAWNFEDYKDYLDRMAALDMNFVGFHCYTGGARRYVNYVEPLIRVEYRGVLPHAELDTSITARWGYRPLTTDQFLYGTKKWFKKKVFGADCALDAKDQEDRYRRAQELMKRVMDYAHKKGIKFCLGFEFGVYPPEFYSIVPPDAMLANPYLPDPTHSANIELLNLYIDDLLQAYPGIDYIWFWLEEMFNPTEGFAFSKEFEKFYNANMDRFSYLDDKTSQFYGVWSLAYIQKAYEILKRKAPNVRMAIGGWGEESQLPPLLKGLHEAAPKEIIFSCLNPAQGWHPQPEIIGNLEGRETWIIPWLEGDRRLWHPQPRVSLLAEQIALAKNQGIDGVIGIHWRTEDIRANFEALGLLAKNPPKVDGIRLMEKAEKENVVSPFYLAWCEREYGKDAARVLAPILTHFDIDQVLAPRRGGAASDEYFPYHPYWGRLPEDAQKEMEAFLNQVSSLKEKEKDRTRLSNLEYLENTLHFVLLLHETGLKIQPAYYWKEDVLTDSFASPDQKEKERVSCLKSLDEAPLQALFETYAARVRSQGERGVLSSLNQKLGLEVKELRRFFEDNP